ncbi:MAG: hypothetical protein Q7T82_11160 [Armatimonadota bacterium]|nr:hypothetical protein [Armatimonadota bacterium]
MANPFIHHSEVQHYFTTSELSELESAGERLEHPYLFHPGPILRGGRAIGTTLDLNDDLRSLPALRGLEIVRPDIERWLPLLQYYDLAPRELSLGTIINAEDGTAILAGFSSLLSDLTEVVCFGFACNQSLPGVSYREDLVAIHERGRRLAAAWKRARLEVEVAIHQLNGHSKVMVRALLLLASGVAVGEDIFGEPGIMRQQESEASTNPLTPSPSKIRLVPRITEDYY